MARGHLASRFTTYIYHILIFLYLKTFRYNVMYNRSFISLSEKKFNNLHTRVRVFHQFCTFLFDDISTKILQQLDLYHEFF